MKIEFLGTGGTATTPKPGCRCRICTEARDKGVPYSRTGPSIFVHGPDIIIDTPEEIKYQLNRADIGGINGCFYSHWHPDHVMGRRVWESINADFRNYPPHPKSTNIYLPKRVKEDFQTFLGSYDHFTFMERQGWVNIIELDNDSFVTIDDVKITPVKLAFDFVYGFLIEEKDKRIFIAPDELDNWSPDKNMDNLDLAILPMGIVEFHPITGERLIDINHPVLNIEATFNDTLGIINKLNAKEVILTHIEEMDRLSYSDLLEVQKIYNAKGYNISFAYDTQIVDV